MISHVHSTTILVQDQDAALDFYTNTLGWEKKLDAEFGPGMRFVSVAPPGATTQIVLSAPSWGGGEATSNGGNTGISLVSHDIDATYKTLTERGVTFKQPVETMPWGQKAAWFSDPDGNEYFLVEE